MKTLLEVIKAKLKGDGITDDKTMIMERTIQLVAKLPKDSKNRVKLTDDFIGQLWNSLDHPPMIYVGDKYMYRRADGSFNVSINPYLIYTVCRVAIPLCFRIVVFLSARRVLNASELLTISIEHHATAARGGRVYICPLSPA